MMDHMNETKDELHRVRQILVRTEEDRDMWRRLFEDCNKKQGEEIERLRQEYKEQSERLGLATMERSFLSECFSWVVPGGASDASRNKSENRSASLNSIR